MLVTLRNLSKNVFKRKVKLVFLLETYIDLPIPGNGPDMANERIVL